MQIFYLYTLYSHILELYLYMPTYLVTDVKQMGIKVFTKKCIW